MNSQGTTKEKFVMFARNLQGAFGRKMPVELVVKLGESWMLTDAGIVWYSRLKLYPDILLEGAIDYVIDTSAFPSISEINQAVIKALSAEWEAVFKNCIDNIHLACSDNYKRNADGNLEKMQPRWISPLAEQMFYYIGCAKWLDYKPSDEGTFKAQFRDTYKQLRMSPFQERTLGRAVNLLEKKDPGMKSLAQVFKQIKEKNE